MKKPSLLEQAGQCAELIRRARNVAVLTGAGVSTSCGIPDFRGPKGLYITRKYDPETVFDIRFFRRDPGPFFKFARDFLDLEAGLTPSFTHRFLAKLEEEGKVSCVVTQNIDSLHQKAGTKNVLEVHGSFWRSYCQLCGGEHSYEETAGLIRAQGVPRCAKDNGVIKPDIVFFGENVKQMDEAINFAQSADLFLVIGSSLVVYPAADLPCYAAGQIVVVNLSPVNLPLMNVAMEINEDIDGFFQSVADCL